MGRACTRVCVGVGALLGLPLVQHGGFIAVRRSPCGAMTLLTPECVGSLGLPLLFAPNAGVHIAAAGVHCAGH